MQCEILLIFKTLTACKICQIHNHLLHLKHHWKGYYVQSLTIMSFYILLCEMYLNLMFLK